MPETIVRTVRDCELAEIAPGARMLDLHHLAQLATARREAGDA